MDSEDHLRVLVVCNASDPNQAQFIETLHEYTHLNIHVLTETEYVPASERHEFDDVVIHDPLSSLRVDTGIVQVAAHLDPRVKRKYSHILSTINPDIILTLGVTRHLFFCLLTGFGPCVLLSMGGETARATVTPIWTDSWLKKAFFRLVYQPLFKQLLGHVDEVWTAAPNRDTYVDLGLDGERFRPFHWGEVNTDLFRPHDDAVAFVDDPEMTVIGCFRRIRGLKLERSFGLFIDALADLADRRDDFHVVIGGFYADGKSKHMEKFIDNRVDKYGIADRFTKCRMVPKSELPRYLSGLDVYVDLPHEGVTKGFGTSSKEAMACGCAFVTYDHPKKPLEKLFPENLGTVIAYDDPASMVSHLDSLCADKHLAKALGLQYRNYVVNRFSQESVAAKAESSITQLADEDSDNV